MVHLKTELQTYEAKSRTELTGQIINPLLQSVNKNIFQ